MDVDAERTFLLEKLKSAGMLAGEQWIDGFQKVLEGRNGGGDLWRTDGRLLVGDLTTPAAR